ncbi:MAG: response regulator transcription factor [Acidobacteriota bacterium]
MERNEIRIVIADDHPIFRQGLRQAIERESDLKVLDEAADGLSALRLVESLRPDVAVLDISMPGMDGFVLAESMREKKLEVGIIFLTMYKEEAAFNRAMDMGVKGYILKDSAVSDIISCIRAVAGGQLYVSPTIASYVLSRSARSAALLDERPGLKDLTPTERRILKMIADNKTSREIARELFVSPRTIDNHRTNISQKLGLRGSHALLKFAYDHKSEL